MKTIRYVLIPIFLTLYSLIFFIPLIFMRVNQTHWSIFWKRIVNFDLLIEDGVISKEDLKLFDFCDTVDEAFEKITAHFKKFYLKNGKK